MSNGNAPSHVSKLPLRSLLYPDATAKFYARVVPFFLKSQKHVDVGYDSGDPQQANRQVEDMVSRGIDGAIVDWYGMEQNTPISAARPMLSATQPRAMVVLLLRSAKTKGRSRTAPGSPVAT